MECKERATFEKKKVESRINRNILECKDYAMRTKTYEDDVLIETYWNVKVDANTIICLCISINRNILECKVCLAIALIATPEVLIETYWNVKMKRHALSVGLLTSINRNILECKEL